MPPVWLDNWEAFLDELCSKFGPFDKTGNAEHELTNLCMKDNHHVTDYLVQFFSLAVCCPWGDSALKYRFYKDLLAQIKYVLSKGDKPWTVSKMQTRVLDINARYWECQQECSCEQQQQHTQCQNPPKASTSSVFNTLMSNPRPTPHLDTHSEQKPNKSKDSKPSTLHVNLTGKLDSWGKLTQQEWQHWIDKNLCLFCRGPGHWTNIVWSNPQKVMQQLQNLYLLHLDQRSLVWNQKKTKQSIGLSTAVGLWWPLCWDGCSLECDHITQG